MFCKMVTQHIIWVDFQGCHCLYQYILLFWANLVVVSVESPYSKDIHARSMNRDWRYSSSQGEISSHFAGSIVFVLHNDNLDNSGYSVKVHTMVRHYGWRH